jgi:hypothetical protein
MALPVSCYWMKHDVALPVTCEDEPGIWLCLSRVRRGQNMDMPVTCEDEPGIWLCLSRVRRGQNMDMPVTCEEGTGYGSTEHF